MLAHTQDNAEQAALDAGPRSSAAGAERFCAVTRAVKPVDDMIRFVPGPDGVVPDLKRKLPEDIPVALGQPDDRDRDALAALEALGYTVGEARNALGALDNRSGMTVEERIFGALQRMDRS